ncbi:MAG: hypothetical protein HQL20_07710 [Candidatus Omnitrophica bacterium]|nr:hypothetical protein [Candidatus Omnitrophota bacterium]
MKTIKVWLTGFLWAGLSAYSAVWAESTGAQDRANEEFNNLAGFMVKVMTGPASKVLALIFLIVAIWKIVHKDYGAAVGCVLALLALVFLPNFLNLF